MNSVLLRLLATVFLIHSLLSYRNSHRHVRPNVIKLNSVVETPSSSNLRPSQKPSSMVAIEAPSMNSRQITASIIVNGPVKDVWSILTDYNNLATHVPNLVKSYLVDNPNRQTRLFQEGAQNIIGFDFRASLVMDMTEDTSNKKERVLTFKLVESGMFSSFDGYWSAKPYRNGQSDCKTQLTYSVFVKPKGPVPVIALEWQIKAEVPNNLLAVKHAAEGIPIKDEINSSDGNAVMDFKKGNDWGLDETLEFYMVRA